MGGEIALITTALSVLGGMTADEPTTPDTAGQMAAERKKTEEAQRTREAEERRRDRDKVTEARDQERRRIASNARGRTTLLNGGTGLIKEPEVKERALKTKLGE